MGIEPKPSGFHGRIIHESYKDNDNYYSPFNMYTYTHTGTYIYMWIIHTIVFNIKKWKRKDEKEMLS